MNTEFASTLALSMVLLGCTDGATDPGTMPAGFDTGYSPEVALASLSESEAIALCEAGSAWINDTTDFVRLAAVSQSLQGDPANCERLLPVYEEVSTDENGDVPLFSEGCAVVGARISTCPQSVGTFEELFEWIAMDIDYRNSLLSCDLAGMPEVWQEIAWTDRTPLDLQPLMDCMLGR